MFRFFGKIFNILLVVLLICVGLYQSYKPLPPGVSVAYEEYQVPDNSVSFLVDKTYTDASGQRHVDQQIFSEIFNMIDSAQQYILIDMFLFNNFQGEPPEKNRALSGELTSHLLKKKDATPDIEITVITDPINNVYGGLDSPHLATLKAKGINVIITDLTSLRDSNPLYSTFWRVMFQWFDNSTRFGFAPNPFDSQKSRVTVRSWLSLLNFKANHRKLIVADQPQLTGEIRLATLITSANPHDGSSAHGNIAIKVNDKLWQSVMASEKSVAEFSGNQFTIFSKAADDRTGNTTVQLLTDGAILEKTSQLIRQTKQGDSIAMAMFYLSERSIINELIAAANRGVEIQLLLDPNKDAFGHSKNGVPNRPVADELVTGTADQIQIRWCDTHGEQCHAKLILFHIDSNYYLLSGSANLTRRNIADYNLETNVLVTANKKISAFLDAEKYFDEIWNNLPNKIYSASYDKFKDSSLINKLLYRFQEETGLSSF